MARTAWPTFITGDSFSAAQANTYNRDNDLAYWVFTTAGDLAYATSASTLARLAIGSTGQSLTVVGGVPTWQSLYPVGIVLTFGVSTNPATLLGFGTWTAIAGKVIVGIDATQSEFDTLNETGGAKTHTLSAGEMPAHTHTVAVETYNDAGGSVGNRTAPGGATATSSAGSGGAHNNLQPYIVKYVWERTA